MAAESAAKKPARGRPFQTGYDPRRYAKGGSLHPISTLLRQDVQRQPDLLKQMVAKAWEQAREGDPAARAWIADRLEGKAVARNENGEPGEFDTSVDVQLHVIRPGEADAS